MSDSDNFSAPVTVIVCAYNAAKYIRDTLNSLIVQTYESLEILIVDDASNDETAAISRSYAERDSFTFAYNWIHFCIHVSCEWGCGNRN